MTPPPPSCPFSSSAQQQQQGTKNREWWPQQMDVSSILRYPSSSSHDIEYAHAFANYLPLQQVKQDLRNILRDSKDWWPADDGHYGPFLIRLAWHSAGTYRVQDGRGGAGSGQIRFAPLNSWPDNGNLDKARRLLWPIKQKYGFRLSWADLFILAGNVALEDMGFETLGYAGGRTDAHEPMEDGIWGIETTWLSNGKRYNDNNNDDNHHHFGTKTTNHATTTGLHNPLGAVQMGLIYVNPEGPNGNPDPLASAKDIRETFSRMAMNDEETVALIAGGHSFGKCHGAADPSKYVGREPEGAPLEEQGFGWKNSYKSGKGLDTITSGLEGAWTPFSTHKWDHAYLENLWDYDWKLTKSPAGAQQWTPVNFTPTIGPDNNNGGGRIPIMLTTDLALKFDPVYAKISQHYRQNPQIFAKAFAKAWYKLTHRDLGPYSRCLGPEVPPPQLWQDPIPDNHDNYYLTRDQITQLKQTLLSSRLTRKQLIQVAWASASTFRYYDKRGGPNGGRLRLEPQVSWKQNAEIAYLLPIYERIQTSSPIQVSLADLYVLGGCAAVEEACGSSSSTVDLLFEGGRRDATQDQTDVESMGVLELAKGEDAFVSFVSPHVTEHDLVAQAHRYHLTASEMICLLGGFRVLLLGGGNQQQTTFGSGDGRLTNAYFTTMLSHDPILDWKLNAQDGLYYTSSSSNTIGSVNRIDLWIGSHSVIRSLAEVYASDDDYFRKDFQKVFSKMMHCDRFDLQQQKQQQQRYSNRSRL